MAKIIAFEGPDKVGKGTQSRLLQEALKDEGHRAVIAKIPSKNHPRSYKLIRYMLRTGLAPRFPNVFQIVQFVNRYLFQSTELPRLLRTNGYVILDRWNLSSLVYGNASGACKSMNLWMYDFFKKADITIVMCEKSYDRKTNDDSYERDVDLQETVRGAYRQWALWHKNDHFLVNNCLFMDDVHKSIVETHKEIRQIVEANENA